MAMRRILEEELPSYFHFEECATAPRGAGGRLQRLKRNAMASDGSSSLLIVVTRSNIGRFLSLFRIIQPD
jgi:hypothetical protein